MPARWGSPEGIVSKRKDSAYRSGRSPDWLNPEAPGGEPEGGGGLGMNLDKAEVSRRQLGTALSLFLADQDPVSVHTLACAGGEIAEHLTRIAVQKPFSMHALASFPDLDIREFRRLQRQYCNAFKHATTLDGEDRSQELLNRFDDEINNHMLFIGWYDYANATGKLPIEAQVFQVWYLALYLDKLNRDVDPRPYMNTFPELTLRRKIASSLTDLNLMRDPQTDARPLILSAS
jgi:hypothetical protein